MVGEPSYYVGEDDVLWDWLLTDNVEGGSGSRAVVTAPDGYVFNSVRAMVKYRPEYGEVHEYPNQFPHFFRKHYLRSVLPVEAEKALMLMSEYANVLTYFDEIDFKALDINEDRVRTVHFFYP